MIKLLGAVGMDEPPRKIDGIAEELVTAIELACKQAEELDYAKISTLKEDTNLDDELLQEQVNQFYAKFKEIINE